MTASGVLKSENKKCFDFAQFIGVQTKAQKFHFLTKTVHNLTYKKITHFATFLLLNISCEWQYPITSFFWEIRSIFYIF